MVSRFEAAQRVRNKQPVIQRDPGEGEMFVMSLSINETVRIGSGEDAQYWRVQKMDVKGNVTFRPHYLGGKLSDADRPPKVLRRNAKTLGKMDVAKVTIDPLGRVNEAND